MRERGIDTVACEDPGWTRLRDTIQSSGLRTAPVPVDEDGLRVDLLRQHPGLRAALVTPAQQFPLGCVLAPHRRVQLLPWPRDVDGLVLEDISPAIGLGGMAVPPVWRESLLSQDTWSSPPPTLDQLALARMLDTGAYDRQLRACRTRCRRRRDLLVDSLAQHLPQAQVTGAAAELHLTAWLSTGTSGRDMTAVAAQHGVHVADLAGYWATEPAGERPGLVLGYGNLNDRAVDQAVGLLAASWRSARGAPETH